jgi:hypothetical protein
MYKGMGWMNPRTVSVETLGETKFARCDLHTVSLSLYVGFRWRYDFVLSACMSVITFSSQAVSFII